MSRLRDREVVRDLAVSLVASALWLPMSAALGSRTGRPALLAGSVVVVFAASFVALRVTVPQRRLRRALTDFCTEPSASKAGDLAVDLLEQLAAAGRLDPESLAELTQRRRHPTTRFLDGVDLLLDRYGAPGPAAPRSTEPILQYLGAVRAAKLVTKTTAATHGARQLEQALSSNSLVLLYGYSSVVCDAVRRASPPAPVLVVRDAQYGVHSSLGEHAIVRKALRSSGIDSWLIDSDQITALLDPQTHRLRTTEGTSLPLPDRRQVVAVIGCEAVDRSGRVLIPATVRSQPSETAWFVAEFARARQRGQGGAIGAQLLVVGESYKVFDDLAARPELRTTSAPVAVSWWRRLLHVVGAADLPRGAPVDLVEIGPDHVDMYVDDVVATRTRAGSLRLDASHDAWNRRVGIDYAPRGISARDLAHVLAECELIFIDFNGVLVDDEVDHYCAFAALARSTTDRSLPIDVYLAACAGRTDGEGVEELVSLGFAAGAPDRLVSEKHRFYEDHAVPVGDRHRARVESVLDNLRRVGPLVLVTASDRASVVAALGDRQLVDEYFPQDRALFEVPGIDRVAMIDTVARRHGIVENRRCLVVDDSTRNLAELRRRGYRTIGVSGLISDRALPADVVVRDLAELGDLLDTDRSRG
jgi:beta-phosphoglucomutase-like phosphatase (HAD superfamily)